MMTLNDFKDIHTHNINAGDDSIINLPWSASVPETGWYSVGVHPWDTEALPADYLSALEPLVQHPRVVAIGETGLDALKGASLSRQEEVFRQHVTLSEKYQKPLIIHSVRTLHDIIRLRKTLKPTQQWVIHGFRGGPELARQLLAAGIDLSLGKKYNPAVPGCVPESRLYHETDAM